MVQDGCNDLCRVCAEGWRKATRLTVTGLRMEAHRIIDLQGVTVDPVPTVFPPYEPYKSPMQKRSRKHRQQHALAKAMTTATKGVLEVEFEPTASTSGDEDSLG